jgi:proteasome beta subunit
LRHAFKYYARTQLQDLSLEGKLQEITRALAGNLPMAMDGIGLFIPVVSAYDTSKNSFGIYFYDALGARFQSGEFAAAGSGSERIRGVFDYIQRERGAFESRSLSDVLKEGLTMLDIAAQLDSATGGFDRMLPTAKTLTKSGISTVSVDTLQKAIKDMNRL